MGQKKKKNTLFYSPGFYNEPGITTVFQVFVPESAGSIPAGSAPTDLGKSYKPGPGAPRGQRESDRDVVDTPDRAGGHEGSGDISLNPGLGRTASPKAREAAAWDPPSDSLSSASN